MQNSDQVDKLGGRICNRTTGENQLSSKVFVGNVLQRGRWNTEDFDLTVSWGVFWRNDLQQAGFNGGKGGETKRWCQFGWCISRSNIRDLRADWRLYKLLSRGQVWVLQFSNGICGEGHIVGTAESAMKGSLLEWGLKAVNLCWLHRGKRCSPLLSLIEVSLWRESLPVIKDEFNVYA